ncbi:Gfo/Idh/MocA family protein [Polynucleobacter sp. AP-Feld-500C-C5]|uniref:Gfo/Idh/MocA family protein n=1 Tax=Polynucleobacter sp. AP-Feld-500C-C5 TaxID=2576924 RepID=UPI001C0B367C|nr:Gfo/Idh/MocA family oxidoreductase [Polynucleobacter sp. AP-Feld-500C-C5]MBU3632884.1 Gfo/Idh/MocA family oxidoreductase [Polynucleobacter sp. AP-Feld-500C-C5]
MIKFGLVGCGRIAKRHADLLCSGAISGATLVAVCDIKLDRAESFGSKYDVSYFTDMHQMAKKAAIDIFVVLTESGNHADHVIELAGYGKHIIVEKPMALTLPDADSMIKACDQAGIKLFVVKQNRFNLPVIKLRQAIENNRFGRLTMGTVRVRWCRDHNYYSQDPWRGTWKLDGGVLSNQASHHIDLLEWMMGPVKSVFAKGITALANIESEDTAVVVLNFESGAIGIIEATTATRPNNLEGSISILGEHGTVEISGFAVNKMSVWQFTNSEPDDFDVAERYSTNPPDVYGFGHKSYLQNIVDSLNNKNLFEVVDGIQGRKSVELINAIYESIITNKEVVLGKQNYNNKLGVKR